MRNEGEQGLPDAWGVHLLTDDVEAVAKATPEHGGSVAFEPMVVGENGSSTLVKDPGGAMVGAWQPNQMKGFEVTGEPGTPAWFELHTRAYEPAVAFYRDVFGWDTHVVSDTDEFRYTTLGEGESQVAGIMAGRKRGQSSAGRRQASCAQYSISRPRARRPESASRG